MAATVRRGSAAAGVKAGRLFVGCSGWQYQSWRGPFYPERLPSSRWLEFYATEFVTVEVNNTFYRLPDKQTFAEWRRRTPDGFTIAVKASRYLTHLKRLRQPGPPLDRLFRRVSALGPRLGPVLYQLPSTLRYDRQRLERFLRALHVRGRILRGLRHVIEFRDPSWYRDDVFDMLVRNGVAICLHDMPGSSLQSAPDVPWLYLRFHGTEGKYRGGYSDRVLRGWARKLRRTLAAGRDCYAYFNNDLGGTAVEDARALIRHVSGK